MLSCFFVFVIIKYCIFFQGNMVRYIHINLHFWEEL